MRAALLISVPVAIVLAAAPAPPSSAGTFGGRAVSCTRVSSAEIHSVLGVPVGEPRVRKAGPVSVCSYGGVIVRVQTGVSVKAFQFGRKQFGAHGERTKTLRALGTAAYSSVIGSGKSVMSTVVSLKSGIELLISAPVSLAKVESLVRKVLPTL